MIKFACILCGERLSVQDQYAGKRIRCPKCNSTGVVPAESPKIKFTCENCGQGIRVLQVHAGKEGKCPKCNSPIVVPSLKADPETGSETITVVCSMCGETIKVPKDTKGRFIECPSCRSNVESSLGGEPVDSGSIPPSADEDEYDDESEFSEEYEGLDRRIIFVISAAALVIVVGLIILVVAILPSDSEPAGQYGASTRPEESASSDLPPRPDVVDERPEGTFSLEPPEQDVAPAEATASPTIANEGVPDADLKLLLSPGWKSRLRIIREDKVSLKRKNESHDDNSVSTTDLEFTVEQVDANNVTSIRVTYLAFREKGESAAGTMEYDSTKPELGTDNPFASTYSSVIGKSFVMRVTPDGRMIGLSGIDQMHLQMARTIVEIENEYIRKNMRDRYDAEYEEHARIAIDDADRRYGSRSEREQAVKALIETDTLLSREKIKGLVGNVIVLFPIGPVETGDSWKGGAVLPAAAPIDIDLTYTFREKTQNATVIAIDSEIDLVNEPAPGPVGPMGPTMVSLTGSYKGSVQIDLNTGWMLHKKATMRCSGRMEMTNRERQTQSTPISVESVTIVEPIE